MVGLIVLLVFLVVFINIVYAKTAIEPVPLEKKEKRCPPHQWVHTPDERLVCSLCSMKPGEVKTKNGEY